MEQKLAASAVVVLAMWAPSGYAVAQQTMGSEKVFGTVFGQTITSRPVPRVEAEAATVRQKGGAPLTNSDGAEIDRAQVRLGCGAITGQIRRTVESHLVAVKGITVSDKEVDAEVQQQLARADQQGVTARQQALNAAMADAVARVYDRGEDPDAVFESSLASKGYSKTMWQSYLVQGKSASFRQLLILSSAPHSVTPQSSVLRDTTREALGRIKLDQAIDEEIARNDEQFKRYLAEMKTGQVPQPGGQSFTMNAEHYRYMEAKRKAWWAARYSEVDLIVQDTETAARCDIGSLGLQVHNYK